MRRLSLLLPLVFSLFTVPVRAGFLDPSCVTSLAALERAPSTDGVVLQLKVIEEKLNAQGQVEVTCATDCAHIDWAKYKGKRIKVHRSQTVIQGGQSHQMVAVPPTEQLVLDTQVLSPAAKAIAADLRKESLQSGSEVGVWLFVTRDGRVFPSKFVNSKQGNELKGEDISRVANEMLATLNRSPVQIRVSEVVFLHTHPTSHPLSTLDVLSLGDMATAFPTITTRMGALPNTDPTLLFLKSNRPR